MKRVNLTILTFGTTLVLIGAAYFFVIRDMGQPSVGGLSVEPTFRVGHVGRDMPLDPTAAAWQDVPAVKMRLYPQTVRAPFGTDERDVWVQAVYNDREAAFRLVFADATEDRDTISTPDACAIMFVPGDAPAAGQLMGHDASANIWHWRADWQAAHDRPGNDSVRAARELIAAGPGTQAPARLQTLEASGTYAEGKWSVVFKRRLEAQQEGELALRPATDFKMSVAVWNGAQLESLSRKSIAMLRTLRLEPE